MDFERLAGECAAALADAALARLAAELALSAAALRRLRCGWSAEHRSFTFPMLDAFGRTVGIRLRRPDGRKFAVRGGHEGLFVPSDLPAHLGGERLLITEGPTDCAAALDLGFHAIGRPSCQGGVEEIIKVVMLRHVGWVAIISDDDASGRRGAERLAAVLAVYLRELRLAVPPAKDLRAWRRVGAVRADVEMMINAAEMVKVRVAVGSTASCRVSSPRTALVRG